MVRASGYYTVRHKTERRECVNSKIEGLRVVWLQRSVRERYLLLAMAALLIGLGVYHGVWLPLNHALVQKRPLVAQLSADLRQITLMRDEMQRLEKLPVVQPISGEALSRILGELALQQGFSLDGWTIESGKQQLLVSGQAEFVRWLNLAAELEYRHQVTPLQLAVHADSETGQVRIDAILVHGRGGK